MARMRQGGQFEERRTRKLKKLVERLDGVIKGQDVDSVLAETREALRNHPVMIALRSRN